MSLEYCIACGEPTGRAGRGDDSLYHDSGAGPYCLECFESVDALTAELAAVKAERDALLGAAINMLKAHMQPLANRPERIANAVRELDAAFVRLYGTDHAKAALAAVED